MKLLSKFIFYFIANILGLYLTARYVAGFHLSTDTKNFLMVGLLLTLANLLIRPIIKLILTPIIFLSLGLALIAINALMLYGVDYYSKDLSIDGTGALIYATLIISVVNIILGFFAKRAYRD